MGLQVNYAVLIQVLSAAPLQVKPADPENLRHHGTLPAANRLKSTPAVRIRPGPAKPGRTAQTTATGCPTLERSKIFHIFQCFKHHLVMQNLRGTRCGQQERLCGISRICCQAPLSLLKKTVKTALAKNSVTE
ncbi:hypothetical protein [Ruegeria sp. B32]|uniref:hypothetical protein n=1 Tax=Ruegeria sp. B32 TaxID=2867020 RepID=UPI0021A2C54D|nr:hypothetical protein [Ruegeria sp. B32]UWR09533.1 hypothetical protein K3752_19380 [Ruegeria sp. B32]